MYLYFPLACVARKNKQTILRNCGLIPCPSYFDSKDFLRVSGKII